jgi:hypothetical protein
MQPIAQSAQQPMRALRQGEQGMQFRTSKAAIIG